MGLVLERPLYLNADKSKVLEEGDPAAAYVLGGAGSTISDEDVEKYELTEAKHGVKKAKGAGAAADAGSEERAKTEAVEEKEDLEALTVVDLKERAKDMGLSGYSAMTKAELIEAIGAGPSED